MTEPESPAQGVYTPERACLECGAPLTPSPHGGRLKRFCGAKCRYHHRNVRVRAAIEAVDRAAKNLREVFAYLDDKEGTRKP